MSNFKKQYSEDDYDWDYDLDYFQRPQSSKNITTENSSTFYDYSSTSNLGNSNSRNEPSFSQQNPYQNQQNSSQNFVPQNRLPVLPNRVPSNFPVQTNYSTKQGGLIGLFQNIFQFLIKYPFVFGFVLGQISMYLLLSSFAGQSNEYFLRALGLS